MSFSEWKKYCLGDIVDIKHGFAFKGEFFSQTPTNDILLSPGNFKIGGGFKADKFKYYKGKYPADYILNEGDVIVTMTDLSKEGDTLGYSAKVPKPENVNYLHNQRLGLLQFKKKEFNKDFIYWLLRTKEYQLFVVNGATGTTVKHTSPTRIREYEFNAPDLKTQQRIASILSSLDDAIELNQQINKTLEEIAKAIFKEWFVDFNYPNATGKFQETEIGKIPVGWKVASFEDVFEADRGLSYKGAGLAESDATPMHNLNSVLEGGGYKTNGIKYYNGDYKDKHIVNAGEVIVANTEQGHKHLLIGYPAIVPQFYGEHGIFSHHIYRLRPKSNCYLSPDFIFHLLLQTQVREQVIGFANGTTVNMLKIEGLQKPKFAMPPKELAEKFGAIAKANRLQAEQNIEENQSLMNLRDTLLPKLMKGEIEINQSLAKV